MIGAGKQMMASRAVSSLSVSSAPRPTLINLHVAHFLVGGLLGGRAGERGRKKAKPSAVVLCCPPHPSLRSLRSSLQCARVSVVQRARGKGGRARARGVRHGKCRHFPPAGGPRPPHSHATHGGFKSLGLRNRLTTANWRVFLALPMAAAGRNRAKKRCLASRFLCFTLSAPPPLSRAPRLAPPSVGLALCTLPTASTH